jgi:hypothetical protein
VTTLEKARGDPLHFRVRSPFRAQNVLAIKDWVDLHTTKPSGRATAKSSIRQGAHSSPNADV